MPYADWSTAEDAARAALVVLADREFLTLGEPAPEPAPRAGLLRRRPAPTPVRFVQAIRLDGRLGAECVGSTDVGGTLPMTPAEQRDLLALGWRSPLDHPPTLGYAGNYLLDVEVGEEPALARLLVASLRTLGLEPGDLVLVGPTS